MQFIKPPLFLILVTLFLSGCTALDILNSYDFEKPSFKYKQYEIGQPTKKSLPVNITLDAHNPNGFGLKDTLVNAELSYKGNRFLKSENIQLELAPNSTSQVVVPIDINYKKLIKSGGRMAEKVLSGKKRIKIKAKVLLHGSPTIYDKNRIGKIFPFSLEVRKTIKVNIPRDKIENSLSGNAKTMYQLARKASDLEEKLKKMKKLKKNIEKLGGLF